MATRIPALSDIRLETATQAMPRPTIAMMMVITEDGNKSIKITLITDFDITSLMSLATTVYA